MKNGLGYRLCSGLTLGALVLASIFLKEWYGRAAFLVFGMGIVFAAVAEYLSLLEKLGAPSRPLLTAAVSAALMGCLVALNDPAPIIGTVVLVLIAAAWLTPISARDPCGTLVKTAVSFSALPALLIPLGFLVIVYLSDDGGKDAFLFLLLVVKMGDTGAYAVGTVTAKLLPGGNHKIVPKVSPKKSWEGTLGGLGASVGIALAFRWLLPGGLGDGLTLPAILGAVLFVGGFFGDLAESALKRAAGAKDSGSWIPGMGGALDIVDSLLLDAPLFFLFLTLAGKYAS